MKKTITLPIGQLWFGSLLSTSQKDRVCAMFLLKDQGIFLSFGNLANWISNPHNYEKFVTHVRFDKSQTDVEKNLFEFIDDSGNSLDWKIVLEDIYYLENKLDLLSGGLYFSFGDEWGESAFWTPEKDRVVIDVNKMFELLQIPQVSMEGDEWIQSLVNYMRSHTEELKEHDSGHLISLMGYNANRLYQQKLLSVADLFGMVVYEAEEEDYEE